MYLLIIYNALPLLFIIVILFLCKAKASLYLSRLFILYSSILSFSFSSSESSFSQRSVSTPALPSLTHIGSSFNALVQVSVDSFKSGGSDDGGLGFMLLGGDLSNFCEEGGSDGLLISVSIETDFIVKETEEEDIASDDERTSTLQKCR